MQLLRGLIAVGVRNPVLANLLMLFMLAGGCLSARGMVREIFPELSIDHLTVEVAYPGAGPEDVERRVCTPIEETLRGLEGIEEISSASADSGGTIWLKLGSQVKDAQAVLKDVKDRVDQLTSLPPETRKPVIRQVTIRVEVVNVAVYGEVPEQTLKGVAQEVKDDLLALPGISQVALSGVRDNEIVIEVSRDALQAYKLSLAQVMAVVAKGSLDLPAGVIRTAEEELTLRVTGQRYTAAEYEDLVVIDARDAAVRLGDIATVREGFEDVVVRGRFNGHPAVLVAVYKTPQEDSQRIAAAVREYVADRQSALPASLHLSVWADSSVEVQSRVSMLVTNGLQGLAVLFAVMWLFLEFRLAFWVAAGIPISFAGALLLMDYYGQSLNIVSLFALIMVSGIIVDDSIVIAESVHTRREGGDPPEHAAIEGTLRMALPVLGSTMVTIIAFVPLLFVVGVMGRLVYVLPIVVIAALAASAVEAFAIEPAHLCFGQRPDKTYVRPPPRRLRRSIDAMFTHVIERWYRPLYHWALNNRMVTISVTLALLLAAAGVWYGGRTPFVLLPKEDGNTLRARVRYPEGTPISVTEQTIERLEAAAGKLLEDPTLRPASGGDLVRQVYSISGEFPDFFPVRGSNLCEVRIELMPSEQRRIDDDVIIERWRHHIGELSDAAQLSIARQEIGPTQRPIEIRLLGQNLEDMRTAADRIEEKLQEFEGVNDVHDDLIPGKRQLRVKLRPAARALGLSLDDVARQLRDGFFGGEAVRFQRGADEIKVRVRYPESERRSVTDLESVRIMTPTGHEVPFLEVADVEWARSYAQIIHQDGKRRVRIQADLDERLANAERIVRTLQAGLLDSVVSDYAGLSYHFGGDRAQIDESFKSLRKGFLVALLANYSLLAVVLRSWAKPLVVMAAVPFGAVGVIGAHLLLGYDLTMMSIFGLVGVSGLVVNEALVLVDSINWLIREGKSVREAVFTVGQLRFRPVMLTSITDLAGLLPLLLNTSGQAQSVQPMAISLSFGLLTAAVLTLLVVPALYLVVNDGRRLVYWLRYGGDYPVPEVVEEATRERTPLTG
jgi:multidrug efflux pump subunit AcrB